MGLFDTVYIDPRILEDNKIHCPKCGLMPSREFQTKDFGNFMESYYFTYDNNKNAKLYKLDEPSDKRFWHQYTEQEIAEMREEAKNAKNKFFGGLNEIWISRGGYWEKEAYLPKNRKHRDMGELPHQICEFYEGCSSCRQDKYDPKSFIEIKVKFTDGVAVSVEQIERNE